MKSLLLALMAWFVSSLFAVQTGRTVNKHTCFHLHDSGGTLRTIPVNSINGVGLNYDEVDVTAFCEEIMNTLPNRANCTITIAGPFDTSAAAAAGTLSGSHTILSDLPGGTTPLTVDIQIGIRHAWEAGEPQFGMTATATSGFRCNNYTVNPDDGTYSATFSVMGSTAPAWGTSAEA